MSKKSVPLKLKIDVTPHVTSNLGSPYMTPPPPPPTSRDYFKSDFTKSAYVSTPLFKQKVILSP